MKTYQGSFPYIYRTLGRDLLKQAGEVPVPTWHAVDISNSAAHVSYELQDVSLSFEMPHDEDRAAEVINPQLPWAEEHFLERVSGRPLNPPPSAVNWLDDRKANRHLKDFGGPEPQFSHTYPERMWPKKAGLDSEEGTYRRDGIAINIPHHGIRFHYGDLGDVCQLLMREPLTRQAFLPIWFPEDTGAVHRERVPCSLGYHFMIREGQLNITYMIRSVDFVRHFCDDVYMAVRLAQWVNEMLVEAGVDIPLGGIAVGQLTMHIMSLHYFQGDRSRMERAYGTS